MASRSGTTVPDGIVIVVERDEFSAGCGGVHPPIKSSGRMIKRRIYLKGYVEIENFRARRFVCGLNVATYAANPG